MRLPTVLRYPKKLLVAMMMVAALAGLNVAVTAAPASAAPAAPSIDPVFCTEDGYLKIRVHLSGTVNHDECYASAGESDVGGDYLTDIWTGNNRVQWFGDGRWQPAEPIGKNTHYGFPNTPGGVQIDKIRIL